MASLSDLISCSVPAGRLAVLCSPGIAALGGGGVLGVAFGADGALGAGGGIVSRDDGGLSWANAAVLSSSAAVVMAKAVLTPMV
jgi:hypothetical protein